MSTFKFRIEHVVSLSASRTIVVDGMVESGSVSVGDVVYAGEFLENTELLVRGVVLGVTSQHTDKLSLVFTLNHHSSSLLREGGYLSMAASHHK